LSGQDQTADGWVDVLNQIGGGSGGAHQTPWAGPVHASSLDAATPDMVKEVLEAFSSETNSVLSSWLEERKHVLSRAKDYGFKSPRACHLSQIALRLFSAVRVVLFESLLARECRVDGSDM